MVLKSSIADLSAYHSSSTFNCFIFCYAKFPRWLVAGTGDPESEFKKKNLICHSNLGTKTQSHKRFQTIKYENGITSCKGVAPLYIQ